MVARRGLRRDPCDHCVRCCGISTPAAEIAAQQAEDGEEEQWSARPPEAGRAHDAPPPAEPRRPPRKAREVYATWYDVPDASLAKRRAGAHELTAAHNRLPIGTLVRVTHLKNGKSVHVRITDRGITAPRVKLDVCKEAAEELGILSKGIARVRMEVIPEGTRRFTRRLARCGSASLAARPTTIGPPCSPDRGQRRRLR